MRYLFVLIFLTSAFLNHGQSDSIETVKPDSLKKQVTFIEEMPEYPGGEKAMLNYIAKNVNYPRKAIRKSVEGTVKLKFVVTTEGAIENITVISSKILGYGCEEEAIRVIQSMPKWKPGKQNGTPVPVYFSIPILFRLE